MDDHDYPALAAWATAAASRVSGNAATVLWQQAAALRHAGQMADELAALRAERDEAKASLSAWMATAHEATEEASTLRARVEALEKLLRRYRDETPLGHQPHMIAAEMDAALERGE